MAGAGLVDVPASRIPSAARSTGQLLVVDSVEPAARAYVESAQACGLHLLQPSERDPSRTTSAGVAALLPAALVATALDRIVVGLGGSATNDGGVGLLESLGADARTGVRAIDLVAATDVDNPLLGPLGATAVFAAAEGCDTRSMMPVLEERLARFADAIGRSWRESPEPERPAASASRCSLLGGHRESGADLVLRAVDLAGRSRRPTWW